MIDLNFEDHTDEVFTTKKPKSRSISSKAKSKQKALLRKEAAKEILDAIGGIPKKGEFIDTISNGQSNGGGFYEVIRDEWKVVNYLSIATWIISREYIDMLFDDLKTGKLLGLTFVISNRMSQLGKGHGPNFNRLKTLAFADQRVNFRVCNSHAKVYCLNNGIDFITISGSANWSQNPRIENYTISNDKSRHDFHATWMNEIAVLKKFYDKE